MLRSPDVCRERQSRAAFGSRWIGIVVGGLAAIAVFGGHESAVAIEMFTFFGDGSRTGLPSLEVPVEAYPGIPLRSDRIRMQRGRSTRWRQGPRQQLAQPIPERQQAVPKPSGGVRIRPMGAESKEWPIAPMPPD